MSAALTLVLGLAAIWATIIVAIVGAAAWIHIREARDTRRRMTRPRPQRETAPDSDDIWAELERVLDQSRNAA